MVKGFRDLEVWQKAHRLVLEIYKLTESFPKDERFGVVSQLRRAAYSIPANLAEGYGRRSTKEFLQFLAVANGSAKELRYFPILSNDLKYISAEDETRLEQEITGTVQMLAALTRSLKRRLKPASADSILRNTDHGMRDTKASPGARI